MVHAWYTNQCERHRNLYHVASHRGATDSVQAHAIAPAVSSRIDNNAIRERVRVASRNGRDMVFIPVDDSQDLESSLLQHVSHGLANFSALCEKLSQP